MAYVTASTNSAKLQNNIMAHAVVRMRIVYAISLANAGWFAIRNAELSRLAQVTEGVCRCRSLIKITDLIFGDVARRPFCLRC
jgi:hypothetical protein